MSSPYYDRPATLEIVGPVQKWVAGWRPSTDSYGLEETVPEIEEVFGSRHEAFVWLKNELQWIAIDDPDVLGEDADVALLAASLVVSANTESGQQGQHPIRVRFREMLYYVEKR